MLEKLKLPPVLFKRSQLFNFHIYKHQAPFSLDDKHPFLSYHDEQWPLCKMSSPCKPGLLWNIRLNMTNSPPLQISIDNWGFKLFYKCSTVLLVLSSALVTARWILMRRNKISWSERQLRQACSSHNQIVIWICFWYLTNSTELQIACHCFKIWFWIIRRQFFGQPIQCDAGAVRNLYWAIIPIRCTS